jgi:hypothetical protein
MKVSGKSSSLAAAAAAAAAALLNKFLVCNCHGVTWYEMLEVFMLNA